MLRQYDPALDELVTVLGEIKKFYLGLDSEILKYLSLNFDPDNDATDLNKERSVLLELGFRHVMTRVDEARGHCAKIDGIYRRHLKRWFHNSLTPQEASRLEELFNNLSYSDSAMMNVAQKIASWLDDEAEKTLKLVDKGRYREANDHIKAAYNDIRSIYVEINESMSDLFKLQTKFIELSSHRKVI